MSQRQAARKCNIGQPMVAKILKKNQINSRKKWGSLIEQKNNKLKVELSAEISAQPIEDFWSF